MLARCTAPGPEQPRLGRLDTPAWGDTLTGLAKARAASWGRHAGGCCSQCETLSPGILVLKMTYTTRYALVPSSGD